MNALEALKDKLKIKPLVQPKQAIKIELVKEPEVILGKEPFI